MTMPEKIWAGDYSDIDDGGYWWVDEYHNTGLHQYIRADLADELARALQKCRDELLSVYHSEFDGVWSKSDFDDVAEYYDTVLCHYYNETTH